MLQHSPDTIDRLFPLYRAHYQALKTDVEAINRSWGSKKPEMQLQELTHQEFQHCMTTPHYCGEGVNHRWIRRIARGHEADFPELAGILA